MKISKKVLVGSLVAALMMAALPFSLVGAGSADYRVVIGADYDSELDPFVCDVERIYGIWMTNNSSPEDYNLDLTKIWRNGELIWDGEGAAYFTAQFTINAFSAQQIKDSLLAGDFRGQDRVGGEFDLTFTQDRIYFGEEVNEDISSCLKTPALKPAKTAVY
jgi:hypothetical protein